MMSSKLKWLIVVQLLLNELALCRVPPPLEQRSNLSSETHTLKEDHHTLLESQSQADPLSTDKSATDLPISLKKESNRSTERITSLIKARLQDKIKDHLHSLGNVSCDELLSASTVDDPSTSSFPQELLGLSLVPVLVLSDCPKEAHSLVLKLYGLLGKADTEELLMDVVGLIERRLTKSAGAPRSAAERNETNHHMDAVMFNIGQLVSVDESTNMQEPNCEGWTRVNGAMLVGSAVGGSTGGLEDAVSSCERLGVLCAGVTSGGHLTPGMYQAVLKKGSRIFPSTSHQSESWIRQCKVQDSISIPSASGQRMKRSPQKNCINKNEKQVYNVVEWIPGVSTLYNLGTAVYYASINCTATAKERAILSAVDLGTDALMVATGGTVGVTGYAFGAGVKTGVKAGVKYLLSSMKEEDDVLVNQFSWDDDVVTTQ